jgi:hypothetical protein
MVFLNFEEPVLMDYQVHNTLHDKLNQIQNDAEVGSLKAIVMTKV